MAKAFILICIIVAGSFPPIGWASPATNAHQRGTWYFSWSGIPFAKLWIDHDVKDGKYALTASFKSRGLLSVFKHVKTFTTSQGLASGTSSQTTLFDYKNNTENKITRLSFSNDGTLISREVKPEDDPKYRPPVAPELLRAAITPGNALLAMRQGVLNATSAHQPSFDTSFYEGKRLMVIHATLGKVQDYEIEGVRHAVQPLILSRKIIAGFTDKEKRRNAEGEPEAILYLDKSSLWPLALEVPIKLGQMKAYWTPE